MDKEQAKFILQSFRPDGADAKDPDFAEALAVAAEDRELGDWLAAERAQDAAFAAALSELAIPAELRENILTVLNGEVRDDGEFADLDSSFIGALASVTPPAGLRDQILTAMQVEMQSEPVDEVEEAAAEVFVPIAEFESDEGAETQSEDALAPAAEAAPAPAVATPEPATIVDLRSVASKAETKQAPRRVFGWLKAAAVAAAVVLGAFVAIEMTSSGGAENAGGAIALGDLEHRAIQEFANVSFGLKSEDLNAHREWITANEAPSFDFEELPKEVSGAKPVGCTFFKMGETKVSLVCFDKDGDVVHVVVLNSEDLKEGDFKKLQTVPAKKDCWQCPRTSVSVAAWEGDDQTYLLLGKMKEAELLKYF